MKFTKRCFPLKTQILLLCFQCIHLFCFPFASEELSAQQGEVRLELSMQEFDVANEKILVRLLVTNSAGEPLVLPRVSEELLITHDIWGGWHFQVYERDIGDFRFDLEGHRLLQEEDLVELQPGESFFITVNIADMAHPHDQKGGRVYQRLIDTDGRYVVQCLLSLSSYIGRIETIASHLQDIVWEGDAESNTLKFFITHEKRRMFFPEGTTPFASPDGKYEIINTESKHDDHGSSEGNYLLSLRETATGDHENIYAYNEDVEVVWSPNGNNLLINDSYAFPLIFLTDKKILLNVKTRLRQTLGENHEIFTSQNVRIVGTEWVNDTRLKVRIEGYKDSYSVFFVYWYEYDLDKGEFKKLE